MREMLPAQAHAWCPTHRLRWLVVAVASGSTVLGIVVHAGYTGIGDAQRGEKVFQQCYACHSVAPSEANLPGPNLAGVIGRIAGTLASYPDYSEARIRKPAAAAR